MGKAIKIEERDGYTLEAVVSQVETAYSGYGETKKIVGIHVKADYVLDVDGEAVQRQLDFTLPLQLRRFALPGDKLVMTVGQTGQIGWDS